MDKVDRWTAWACGRSEDEVHSSMWHGLVMAKKKENDADDSLAGRAHWLAYGKPNTLSPYYQFLWES